MNRLHMHQLNSAKRVTDIYDVFGLGEAFLHLYHEFSLFVLC